MGALGSFILAGTLKTLSISVESAQIVRVSLANEALARAVGGVLNSPEECKKNLKPGTDRLTGSDSGNGIGDLTQLTKGQDVVLSTSTQNGDNIFKYSFDIIKMQLSGEGTLQKDSTDGDDAKKRTFTVYYKKRGVGSLSTLGDLECSADSQLGCYFYQCDLSYELDNSSPPNVKVCRSLTCVSGGGGVGAEIAGQMCELGEYLVGFTAGGAKICVDMSCDCKDMGDDEATCRSNNWKLGLQGVKEEEGNMIPVCVRLLKVEGQTGKAKCDLGKFATGYDTNGDVICEEYECPGGMEKDETDQKCKCPDVKPYWDGSKCIESSVHSCPATAPYSYNSRCVNSCPQTLPVVGRNKVCQSCMQVNPNTPYWNKRLKKCVSSCPTYYQNQHRIRRINYWSSTNNPDCFLSNACGEGETRTASGGCEVSCPSGSSHSCATCPPGTIATFNFPNYRSSCINCPKHRPYLSGSTCVASCPSTKALDPVKKICVEKYMGCPPDRPKVGTNGQCEACPAGTYWKFVPSTQNFDHGPSQEAEYYRENYDDHYFCSSTCPSNQHKHDGRCVRTCPPNKPKVGANNVCVACPTGHHWNRITKTCNNCPSTTPYWSTLSEKCVSACPSGTTLNYARKACVGNDCPIDKPYKSGNSCVSACDRFYVYNNKCVNSCPAGSTAVSTRAWRSRRICVPLEECPDTTPYYSGSSTAPCVSTCPSDRQYKYNNICVSTCPSSKPKVGANNVCEACPTNKPKVGANNVCEACSGTTPYWSGSACVSACPNDKRYKYNKTCVSACPPDKPKVGANNVCEACPPNKPYHKLSPRQAPDGICVASCDGYEGISVTQENYTCSEWYSCTPQEGGSCCGLKHNNYCVQYCPTSHPYSSSTGCVNSCPSNTTLDTETRSCVTSCPAGQIRRNNQCVADNVCLATTYFDVPTGNCVSACPDSRPKKANNTCVESCPDERPKTGSNNVCEACSGTTPYWSGSACVSACPTDKPHIDSDNNHCMSTCPSDRPLKLKEKRGGKFVCIDDCIGNLIRGANKECVCPAGKPYRYNGISFCVSSCVVPNHQATTDKWCIPNTQ